MNPVLKKIIEGVVGIVIFIIVLRLILIPTYAFIHSRSEPLMIILIIFEALLSVFIAYNVVRYIHRHL
jgi:hypothetical protein